MPKPPKMYMLFAPGGTRNYESLRFTAKGCKLYKCSGDLKMWTKYHKQGWRVWPVVVDVKLFRKISIPPYRK